MDLKLLVVAVGVCILLVSILALFARSESGSIVGDVLIGFTVIVGVLVIFAAPVVSGLINYMRFGTFEFTWWW